jgi:hypothetical protein
MNEKRSLLGHGLSLVMRNKRYIVWFWVLNFILAWFGTSAFRNSAEAIMNHRLYSKGLVHGFDIGVLYDLFSSPEFGPMNSKGAPAVGFAVLFFIATAFFIPGVFAGYASTYRLPRDDFFRACGRNLWRFIRLMMSAGIVMVIIAVILFGINAALAKKGGESTNELLPFELQMIAFTIIFLVMTTLRIWFDLAEADTVLNDQRAVRRSIAAAFRHTFRGLARLLSTYVVVTIVAALILAGGLLFWMRFVPPSSVAAAFVVSQATLFLLLIPRFWQRAIAVSYWQQRMLAPVVAVAPSITPESVADTPVAPELSPVVRETPSSTPQP